jgi:hypothetical protein
MWRNLFGRDKSRAQLASALIGEITAAIETLESNPEIKFLENVAKGEGDAVGQVHTFALPRFAVYEENASRLSEFAAPLPHQLSYFYTELEGLQDRVCHTLTHQTDEASRRVAAAQTLAEISRIADLGDQLLRDLRPLIARHYSSALTRA